MRYLAAFCASLLVSLGLGPVVVPFLRSLKLGQRVRTNGPATHIAKAGTPTMGGLLFLLAAAAGVAAACAVGPGIRERVPLATALFVTGGFALVGLGDDMLKVVYARPLGMRARDKLFAQVVLGVLLGAAAERWGGLGAWVGVPFTAWSVDLGGLYVPFVAFMAVAESNAVNLTDGLDGLAAGACAISFGVYAIVSALKGNQAMVVFSLAFMGALIGFLRYNVHPAQVFMGDTGSMALGAALASVAVMTKTETYLAVIGGLYLVETLSVALQVTWFQTTGKRIFRMSPLHHHFELLGWPEEAVVGRFWVASLLFGTAGLAGIILTRS